MVDDAALFRDERHHVANVFVGTNHERLHHRLFDFGDISDFGQVGRIINLFYGAVRIGDAINDARVSGDDIHAILAPQPFLNDFEVQQTQKSAAKTEPQSDGRFRLVNER